MYHFAGTTLRDDSPLPRKYEKRRVDGEIKLCEWGLHASRRAIDALKYAPGQFVAKVELHDGVVDSNDKSVAHERENLTDYVDVSMALHEFTCQIAEGLFEELRQQGKEPDARSVNAVSVKRLWMQGKATDEELKAARDAAWDAASDAVWAAALAASLDAAWAAAWAAARDAAWAAARDAAWAAEWAAARDAEWAAALNDKLEQTINAELEKNQNE